MNQPLKKNQFEILDSVRGIASLYVVIAHCRGCLWIGGNEFLKKFPYETWNVGDYLMFGTSMLTRLAVEFVIIFFVLSGFSIAHSLSSNKSILQFYKRRFIRIYPSFLVALVWAGLVFVVTRYWYPQWYDGTMTDFAYIRAYEMNNYFDWDVMLKNIFYMPSGGFIAPFWSLTYEVIFYLLAPFLLKNARLYLGVSVVLFLAHLTIPGTLASLHLPVYIYNFFFVFNIYFAIGAFLYTHYQTISGWFSSVTKLQYMCILAILLAGTYGLNIYFRIESDYSFIVASLLSVVLILFFLTYQVRIKPLVAIGRYSYTLYITHLPSIFLYLSIYWLIAKPQVPYILNYFVWMPAVFFCLAMAWIQYQLVEKRTKGILSRLRGNVPKAAGKETVSVG
jgi:peptidoglycan/LPS O-acetylase OafA/YrhL